MYEFRNVYGHIQVYLNGVFVLSADTMKEAREELEKLRANRFLHWQEHV